MIKTRPHVMGYSYLSITTKLSNQHRHPLLSSRLPFEVLHPIRRLLEAYTFPRFDREGAYLKAPLIDSCSYQSLCGQAARSPTAYIHGPISGRISPSTAVIWLLSERSRLGAATAINPLVLVCGGGTAGPMRRRLSRSRAAALP